jgi:hypothetical protein
LEKPSEEKIEIFIKNQAKEVIEASPSNALSLDWETHVDPISGDQYYHNRKTGNALNPKNSFFIFVNFFFFVQAKQHGTFPITSLPKVPSLVPKESRI